MKYIVLMIVYVLEYVLIEQIYHKLGIDGKVISEIIKFIILTFTIYWFMYKV